MLVAVPGTPLAVLLEVKDKRGKLTPTQIAWQAKWNGRVEIVHTISDVKEILRRFMPTYVYDCAVCHEKLEVRQKFSDPPLCVCPRCGGILKRLPQIVGITYSDNGFTKRVKKPRDP